MRISLGPVQYFWPRETLDAFYEAAAGSEADIVYLGETVCSKRRSFRPEEWLELAAALTERGKEVALSTLTLIEARSETGVVKRLCGNGRFRVEANDMTAVQLAREAGAPFIAGPALNVYNLATLRVLLRAGLTRWVMPYELSRDTLAALLAEAKAEGVRGDFELEVVGYGRIPLSYSARCFTARAHNLPKDQCGLRCIENPEGIPLATQEGERFLTINGIQTQSGAVYDLLPLWPELAALGVDIVRVSPRPEGTFERLAALRAAMSGGDPLTAESEVCDGYWFGQAGMAKVS